MKRSIIGFAVLSVLVGVRTAECSITAMDFSSVNFHGLAPVGDWWTLGWEFTATSTITVTELGYYDHSGDGLSASHQVGLWDDGGTLLVSTTVDPSDPVDGLFRYKPVGLTILAANQSYRVGGVTLGDIYAARAVNPTFGPDITYVVGRSLYRDFGFPTDLAFEFYSPAEPSAFGANFKYLAGAIPEPSSLVVWSLLGGLGLSIGWWRRRRRAG